MLDCWCVLSERARRCRLKLIGRTSCSVGFKSFTQLVMLYTLLNRGHYEYRAKMYLSLKSKRLFFIISLYELFFRLRFLSFVHLYLLKDKVLVKKR